MNSRLVKIIYLSFSLAITTNFLATQSSHADGTGVDSFTYNGNQPGMTTGTVYTLSTATTQLGFCTNLPSTSCSSSSSNSTSGCYTTSCMTNLAPVDSKSYLSVAYLGTVNNPNSYFAVGDDAGNVTVMAPQFYDDNGTVQVPSIISVQTLSVGGCQVTTLAVDPNGKFLYIGCIDAGNNLLTYANGNKIFLGAAYLGIAPINADGTLGTVTTVTGVFPSMNYGSLPAVAGYWHAKSKDKCCGSVSPKMRVYAPNYPGLSGSGYYSSGAVLYSGLIGQIDSSGNPVNSGLLCSNGGCQIAYNLTLTSKKNFSVVTSAEYGIYGTNNTPALYWNEVQGEWIFGVNETPGIPKKASSALVSCQINNVIGFTSSNSSSCVNSKALSWPPQGISSGTKWIEQMTFMPQPEGNSSAFISGVLIMSTWNNGYLAYYSPATPSTTISQLLSGNGSQGELGGNVYTIKADQNGNLLVLYGAQGLSVLNLFSGTNIANGTDMTLIPNTADNGGGGGVVSKILTGSEIAYYTIGTIMMFTTAADLPATEGRKITLPMSQNNYLPTTQSPTLREYSRHTKPSLSLMRPLGQQSAWNEYEFTEKQMKDQGIKPGTIIEGIKLRLSQGVSPQPKKTTRFKLFRITLNGQVVRDSPLQIGKESYGQPSRDRYGPKINFDQRFVYSGGDLRISISHTGSEKTTRPFLLEALGGEIGSGKYTTQVTLSADPLGPINTMSAVPAIEFVKTIR